MLNLYMFVCDLKSILYFVNVFSSTKLVASTSLRMLICVSFVISLITENVSPLNCVVWATSVTERT